MQFTIRGVLRVTFVVAVFCCFSPLILQRLQPTVQTLPSPYYLRDDVQYFPAKCALELDKSTDPNE